MSVKNGLVKIRTFFLGSVYFEVFTSLTATQRVIGQMAKIKTSLYFNPRCSLSFYVEWGEGAIATFHQAELPTSPKILYQEYFYPLKILLLAPLAAAAWVEVEQSFFGHATLIWPKTAAAVK